MDRSRKWLVDANAGKSRIVSFDWSNDTGAIDVKINGSIFEENHLLRCQDVFSSNLDWGFFIVSITKTAFKKIEASIGSSSRVCSSSL